MKTSLTRKPLAALAAAGLTILALAACSPEEAGDSGSGDTGDTADAGEAGDAYEDLINSGPLAEDSAVEASQWASAVKDAGVLKVGGTETSELFSLLDPAEDQARGFDAAISQLLSRYIIGEVSTELQQVTVDTRESLLESNTVDVTIATYSVTPERAERVGFAGPYYSSQAAILVKADNDDITGLADLAGKDVATQANSTGVTVLENEAPEANILGLPDHAQALAAVQQGNADAYVIDQTLLMNAVVAEDDVKIVGEPFGPEDRYGIGVNKDSDATEFINTFLQTIYDDGTWAKVWELTIGERTGLDEVPAPPAIGDLGI